MDLPDFNAAPAPDLVPALLTCCDVPAWAAAVQHGRPYPDRDALLTAADGAMYRAKQAGGGRHATATVPTAAGSPVARAAFASE